MASQIDICNMALASVGISQTIQSLSDSSLSAQVCSLYYPTALDNLLREAPWGFALQNVALAQLDSSPTADFLYAYQLPTDSLVTLRILTDSGRVETAPTAYRIMRTATGSVLVTDKTGPTLQYIQRVTDPTVYTPDFILALSYALGTMIAMPLKVDQASRDACRAEYRRALGQAKENNANEAVGDPSASCEFLSVR